MALMSRKDWETIRWFNPGDVPSWEKLNRDLLFGINAMAGRLGVKPVFTSTWRSPEHNAAIGGQKDSEHLRGQASDVMFPGRTLEDVYQAAREAAFRGIGLYPEENFIHVDVRSKPGTWARIQGVYTGISAAFDWLKKKRELA